MTETDSDGKISWILTGERLEKFPNSERSEVFMPQMQIKSSEKEQNLSYNAPDCLAISNACLF